ncbi:MAG: tRNA (N6-isopentenyl adenosine(37)-C2)-methylthiotransferase MiaB [Dehalogenimonas sp.]
MPDYHIFTIGCQMNQSEAERLGNILAHKGYFPVDEPERADLVLLVSCAVRQSAEERITNRLAILKKLKTQRPELRVALTGCMVGEDISAMKKQYPMVDYFFSAGSLPEFLDEIPRDTLPEKPDVSVYVPIIQGCDNFCSYCIVPYRRGREKSRPLEELEAEVRELVSRGAREVTLLGQNVNAWGHDLPGRPDLADLLMVLDGIEDLYRLRFLTNHPKDMTDRLIRTISRLPKVCPAVNLPVQAGDDEILRLMRRDYTSAEYRSLVERIRQTVPDISLTTDVIVGFPGETRDQYNNTRRLIEDMRFDAVHSAVYSPRPGTEAAEKYRDDVSAVEKSRRLADLEALQTQIAEANNQTLVGTLTEVLVENTAKDKWRGRNRHGKLVFFESRLALKGQLVNIKINAAGPWSLRGELVAGGV